MEQYPQTQTHIESMLWTVALIFYYSQLIEKLGTLGIILPPPPHSAIYVPSTVQKQERGCVILHLHTELNMNTVSSDFFIRRHSICMPY